MLTMKTTVRFMSLAVSVVVAHAAAAIECVDISGETARHSVVAAGTTTLYNGHPSTILMPDGRTMFCFWPINHAGRGGPAARSDDDGRTWRRIDGLMPKEINRYIECPMAHRLVDPQGRARPLCPPFYSNTKSKG